MWVGIAFAVCFVTGLTSHLIQNPPAWFGWPSRPVNLYRFTQGLHVTSGFAAIPLLLAKLWTVYPSCSNGRRRAASCTQSVGCRCWYWWAPPSSSSSPGC